MTISRAVLRTALATIAVGGIVVICDATRNAMRAANLTPDCNCNTRYDCDLQDENWSCSRAADLCNATTSGCGDEIAGCVLPLT